MASIISVPNETNASVHRATRDGRKITYEMTVIQQPQRARACGSGAKSSADRRPVDPPPVVELKIYEGENGNRKDITFSHNANFFLYSTLESARPIATARGTNSVATPHPVLTGMPVAGMAYLDRPTQAGYFIFPDLSVRHEGKFRLSFNLYEELKEAKDKDPEGTAPLSPKHGSAPIPSAGGHVHFRLEVKSAPFTVYSAKKFPGLAESTPLSRLVAEQGCRVRIRRDVRMRRREAKPGDKYDGYSDDEQPAYAAEPRYATPDSYHHERASSVNGNPPTLERRPSAHELPPYYPQTQQQPSPAYAHPPPPPPPSATQQPVSYSHLHFGGSNAGGSASSSAAPTYQPGQPPYQPPPPPSAGYAYQAPPPPPAAPHHRPSSSAGSSYAYAPPPPRSAYPRPPSRPSYAESEYSRPRTTSGAPYSYPELPAVDTAYQHGSSDAHPRSTTPSANKPPQLPPLKNLTDVAAAASKYDAQPLTPSTAIASSPTAYEPAPPPMHSAPPTSAPPVVGKRAYGNTFDDGQNSGTGLSNGARPEAVGQDVLQIECDDGTLVGENDLPDYRTLTYRRADGTRQYKKISGYP